MAKRAEPRKGDLALRREWGWLTCRAVVLTSRVGGLFRSVAAGLTHPCSHK